MMLDPTLEQHIFFPQNLDKFIFWGTRETVAEVKLALSLDNPVRSFQVPTQFSKSCTTVVYSCNQWCILPYEAWIQICDMDVPMRKTPK